MSLQLDFEPHSWYMGFAIRKDNNPLTHSWGAYAADGMTGYVVEIEAMHLSTLKRSIRQHHLNKHTGYGERLAKKRLEYLRGELQAGTMSYGERPGIYGDEAVAEMDACDQDKLYDALYDLCFDERHPDDFGNLGNYDNYTSLTREQQLAVLEAARK